MKNKKPGFLLYLNQKVIIDELTNEEAGILIKSIYEYEETKKIPKLNKMLKIIFLQFKNLLDNDEKNYEEKCVKNKKSIEKYWKKKKEQEDTNEYERIQTYTNNNNNNNNNSNNNINNNNNSNNNNNNNNNNMYVLSSKLDDTHQICEKVINYLNKVGTIEDNFKKSKKEFHFRNTKNNQKLIKDILDKGYTKEDILDVIFLKYDQWIESKNKIDMSTYYRPSTIFGDKFDEYYEEAKMKGIS